MMTVETSKEQLWRENNRNRWEKSAVGLWNTFQDAEGQSTPAAKALLQWGNIQPEDKVLDLAAGIGMPSFLLATKVGPAGLVVSTDLVSELSSYAQRVAQERQIRNILFQRLDLEEVFPFTDNNFDKITCMFGIGFAVNIEQTLQEILRTLRPGGKVALSTHAKQLNENSQFLRTQGILRSYPQNQEVIDPNAPNQFRFDQPGLLAQKLSVAGFNDVREESITVPWTYPNTPNEFMVRLTTGPSQGLLKKLEESGQREEAEAKVFDAISELYDSRINRINFTTDIIIVTGSR